MPFTILQSGTWQLLHPSIRKRLSFARVSTFSRFALNKDTFPEIKLVLRGGSRHLTRAMHSDFGSRDQSDSADAEENSKASKRKKIFLIDLDENGKEISRRLKGRGRTPSGYVQSEGFHWTRVLKQEANRRDDINVDSVMPSSLDEVANVKPISFADLKMQANSTLSRTPDKWIVFSDLHVSRNSLETCLHVLGRIHHEASIRNAGVIFLGDFWHEKGVLRVDALSSILLALSNWTVPVLALPGNHDQATFDGETHALTPLGLVLSAGRIISKPSVLLGALWVPYTRSADTFREIIKNCPLEEVSALFCHVDVIGADLGLGMKAERGLNVSDFPADIPVYTGHYHRPQKLWGTSRERRKFPVQYVGSPYQTSMSEAHEDKFLLVLDATKNWRVEEEIPIQIGRRHYIAKSIDELEEKLLAWKPCFGDRIQLTVDNPVTARQRLAKFNLSGVSIEVREKVPELKQARIPKADILDPSSLLCRFFDLQGGFGEIDEAVKEAASGLLQEVLLEKCYSSIQNQRDIVFESVELKGYCSFGPNKKIVYPLEDRGVVLVMGRNQDETSCDSNGSGKTNLCMAPLWALTGSADVRADGKRLGRKDVVHQIRGGRDQEEPSVTASVTVKGRVNGQAFSVQRKVSEAKGESHSLKLKVGDKDLTQSSLRDTQAELEQRIPVQVISDAVFHGQHLITGILDKTDKDFKATLDNVISSEIWSSAQEIAKDRKKKAKTKADELNGRLLERQSEQDALKSACLDVVNKSEAWNLEMSEKVRMLSDEIKQKREEVNQKKMDVSTCRLEVSSSSERMKIAQGEFDRSLDNLQSLRLDGQRKRAELEVKVKHSMKTVSSAQMLQRQVQVKLEELCAIVARMDAIQRRKDELTSQSLQWKGDVQRRIEGTTQDVQSAKDDCERYRKVLGERIIEMESTRLVLLRKLNESDKTFEEAYDRRVRLEEAWRTISQQVEELEDLQHRMTCHVCLQPINHSQHMKHLIELKQSKEVKHQEMQAASEQHLHSSERRKEARRLLEEHYAHMNLVQDKLREDLKTAEENATSAKRLLAELGAEVDPYSLMIEAALRDKEDCTEAFKNLFNELGNTGWREQFAELGFAASFPVGGFETETDVHTAWRRVKPVLEEIKAQLFDLEAACNREVLELEKSIASIDSQTVSLEQNLSDARSRCRETRQAFEDASARLELAMAADDEIKQLETSLAQAHSRSNPWLAEVNMRKEAEKNGMQRMLELQEARDLQEQQQKQWDKIFDIFGKKGIQSFVYEVAILELQQRAEKYLEVLSEDSLRLQLALDGPIVERKILIRMQDGSYSSRTLHQLSGGQWRRLSLALALAFSEWSMERTATSCNLLVLDEVMQHLDSEGCMRVSKMLEDMIGKKMATFSTVLVVLQTQIGEELGDSFDHMDVVVKSNDESQVMTLSGKRY